MLHKWVSPSTLFDDSPPARPVENVELNDNLLIPVAPGDGGARPAGLILFLGVLYYNVLGEIRDIGWIAFRRFGMSEQDHHPSH